jgi:hypothetical protein
MSDLLVAIAQEATLARRHIVYFLYHGPPPALFGLIGSTRDFKWWDWENSAAFDDGFDAKQFCGRIKFCSLSSAKNNAYGEQIPAGRPAVLKGLWPGAQKFLTGI